MATSPIGKTGKFGDLPLVVLTRGRIDMKPHPSEIDRQFNAYTQVWMHEIQPKLAALSTRGEQIIVPYSGHDIPNEAPIEIVKAITKVMLDVRGGPLTPANEGQKLSLDTTKKELSKRR